MYGIVYCVQNLVNDKLYIGQTVSNFKERKRVHLREAKKGIDNNYFHNALRKYKETDWEWNVLQFAYCKAELDALEKYWLWVLNSIIPNGYNLKEGGSKGKLTEETKRKIGEANKGNKYLLGYKQTEEHIKNNSMSRRGFKQTEEAKNKQKKASIKMWQNPGFKKRMSENKKGEKNSNAKLVEKQVKEIRADTIHTQQWLANKYSVSRSAIADIKCNLNWKGVA